jgi:hypothetical protein
MIFSLFFWLQKGQEAQGDDFLVQDKILGFRLL